jgi:hypothetical protein
VTSHGAGGKAYVARTKKRVYIGVWPSGTNNPPPAFSGKFVFTAAGLKWDVKWLSPDEVRVHFVDYGEGVSSYSDHKTVTNSIGSLTFVRRGDAFVEAKE